MPTIKDIARQLGLSSATVSRALHDADSPFVSAETRRRVREAAERLGYLPNPTGRALVTGRTNLVSLWINDPYTPYYALIGHHLQVESERRGYQPVVRGVSTQSQGAIDWQAPDGLAEGILVVDVNDPLERFLRARPAFRRPLVAMGSLCTTKVDHVRIDLYRGSVEAVEHLVATRSGRIVALMYAERDPRTEAYRDVMGRAGREPDVVPIPDEARATNRRRVRDYIEARGCPGALFCQNDDVALAAYRAALDCGLRVPDDVALVGCDGIEDTEYLEVPLSTVVHPVGEMVALAWRFLERRMADPSALPQSAVLPSRLLVRASSSCSGDTGGGDAAAV
ncbi:MAG: LacI family DNA-binding transcriptional regulator [Chthonomonadales bacterium]|nr:LacI family DNA-binding transcriptional regulator [Chthonomonadales bacterium]